jgi:lysozyme family protein
MSYQDDTNFCRILPILLAEEGGYSDDSNDPGGATNFGISQRSYPSLDIANLTVDQAANVYYTDFWLKNQCDAIPVPLAFYHFDSCVNAGPAASVRILQQTVGVPQDGVLGPVTLAACAGLPATQYYLYMVHRLGHYQSLPGWGTYGNGWTNRLFRLACSL